MPRHRAFARLALPPVLLAVLAACAPSAPRPWPAQEEPSGKSLTVLGPAARRSFPSDLVEFKVLLLRRSQRDARQLAEVVVSETPISWSILGRPPAGASLSAPRTLTNSQGIAKVTLAVGHRKGVTFQVQATTQAAPPATFTVTVRSALRTLQVLGPKKRLRIPRGGQATLTVQLLRGPPQTPAGTGVPNAAVSASLQGTGCGSVRLGGAHRLETLLLTDGSGIARATLLAGNELAPSCAVLLCASQTCQDAETQRIDVEVHQRTEAGGLCTSLEECEEGTVCLAGRCEATHRRCQQDDECPPGQVCGPRRMCIPTSSHRTGPDQETGSLDVGGRWSTRYHLDISDTLPAMLSELTPVVDLLNLVFARQFEITVPFLGDVIEVLLDALIAEYVPEWVTTVAVVLSDLVHLFSYIEAQGELFLVPDGQQGTGLDLGLRGEEIWHTATVSVASLCLGGPAALLEDPRCGDINVVLNPHIPLDYSNNTPTVGVNLQSFEASRTRGSVLLADREVQLAARQLLHVLLDVVVRVASNGAVGSLEELIANLISCPELQYAYDQLICDLTRGDLCTVPGVELACEGAILAAEDALAHTLDDAPLHLELRFDARATALDTNGDGVADELGQPQQPSSPPTGVLSGTSKTSLLFSGELGSGSWWHAARAQERWQ